MFTFPATQSASNRRPIRIWSTMIGFLLSALALTEGTAQAVGDKPVTQRFLTNAHGDIEVIGNTLGWDCNNTSGQTLVTPIVPNAAPTSCGSSITDTATDIYWSSGTGTAAANTTITPAQAQSDAVLTLPSGASVLYAQLYFGGCTATDAVGTTVTLSRPGGFSKSYTALASNGGNANSVPTSPTVGRFCYGNSVDATKEVQANGSGVYRVSGVTMDNIVNANDNVLWANWHLVVVYDFNDDTKPTRNLAIFDGFQWVTPTIFTTANLNGFLAPNSGLDGKLGAIAYEGEQSADLQVTMTDDLNAGTVKPGDPVTYTVTVKNNGPFAANGATLSDVPVAALQNVTWTCSGTGATCPANSGSGSIGATVNLPINGQLVYMVTGTVNPSASVSSMVYTASIAPPGTIADLNMANNSASSRNAKIESDLSLAITHTPASANPGDSITYTAIATNNGPGIAPDGTVSFDVPAGLQVITPAAGTGWTCTNSGNSFTCNRTNLAVGPQSAITVVVKMPDLTGPPPAVTGSVTTTTAADLVSGNNSTSSAIPDVNADMQVSISRNPDAAVPGTVVTYTIQAQNNGPGSIPSPSVTFAIPAGVTVAQDAAGTGWTCTRSGNTYTCTRGPIASGAAPPPITAKLTLPSDTTQTVSAGITSANVNDPNMTNNSATLALSAVAKADFQVTMSDTLNSGSVKPNDRITYTVIVKNTGPLDATDAVITDSLPAGLQNVTWTCTASPNATCPAPSGINSIMSSTADLPKDEQLTFNVTGTVNPALSVKTVQYSVTANPPSTIQDPNPADNTATSRDAKIESDLSVVITHTPTSANPDDPITYKVQVTNNGPGIAPDGAVTFSVPAGATIITPANGMGWDCGTATNPFTCKRNDLAVGDQPAITVVIAMPNLNGLPPQVTGTVSTMLAKDPSPGNDTASDVIPDINADMKVSITRNPDVGLPGTEVTYTIQATNLGPGNIPKPTVLFAIPAGLTITQDATGSGWTCDKAGNTTYTCQRGPLAQGDAPPITVKLLLPQGASPAVTAGITSPNVNDAVPENNNASLNLSGNPSDLAITLSGTPAAASPGDPITYTAQVKNNGNGTAPDTTVTVNLPPGVTVTQPMQSGGWNCSQTNQTLTCIGGSLPPGDATPITIAAAMPNLTAGPLPSLVATISTPTGADPVVTNNTSSALLPKTISDLAISITRTPLMVQPGEEITYTMDVTNQGPGTALDPTVTFTVPSGLGVTQPPQGTNWTCTANGNVYTCKLSNLATGASAPPLVAKLVIPAGQPPLVAITAGVDSQISADPDLSNNNVTSTASNTVADLAIALARSTNTALPGDELTYAATVVNNGPSGVSNPTVTFSIPAEVTVSQPPQGTGWSCSATGNVFTCSLATLASGAVAPPLSAKVLMPQGNPAAVAPIHVSVSAPAVADPTPANNSANAGLPLPVADLGITLSKSPDQAKAGEETTYTLQVTNYGPATAVNPLVTFTLPPGVQITMPPSGDGWTCTAMNTIYTCTRDSLAKEAAPPIIAKVRTPADGNGGVPAVMAVVGSASTSDPNSSNNTALVNATVPAVSNADLSLAISRSPQDPQPGQEATYTLALTNNGPDTAIQPSVTFSLPAGVIITQPAQGNGWACVQRGNEYTCVRAEASVGPAPPITVKVITPILANPGDFPGLLAGVASAVQNRDANPLNNAATISLGPTPHTGADLSVKLTRSSENPLPGEEVTYTLQATNHGPDTVQGVAVTLDLPPGSEILSAAAGDGWQCTQVGTTFLCTRNTLSPGDAPPLVAKVKLPQSSPNEVYPGAGGGAATIQATGNTDPNPADNTSILAGSSLKLSGGGLNGCTCEVGGHQQSTNPLPLLAMMALAIAWLRRRVIRAS